MPIIVKDTLQQAVIQFTHSNDRGEYSIPLREGLRYIIIEVNSMVHQSKTVVIENVTLLPNPYILHLDLLPRVIELQEVTVKAEAPAVKQDGDTTAYTLSEFLDGTERVVEDIIKKLPGMEVTENGTVKFKGKPISKLLLDGDDLFDHKYTIGTRNISAKMINGLQAIENYVDNPLLKGLKNSEDVVVNLTLTKGHDISGNVNIGASAKRFDVGATVLGISAKYKAFLLSKYNNVGDDYTPYDLFSGKEELERDLSKETPAPMLLDDGYFNSSLGNSRARINSNLYNGVNTLVKVTRKTSLKINLAHHTDRLFRSNARYTTYYTERDTLETSQIDNLIKKPNGLNSTFELRSDFSGTKRLEFFGNINTQRDYLMSKSLNNAIPIDSKITTRDNLIKFKIIYTSRMRDKSALQLTSFFLNNRAPQIADFLPGYDFIQRTYPEEVRTNQEAGILKMLFDSKADLYKRISSAKMKITAGFSYTEYHINSETSSFNFNQSTPTDTPFANDVTYTSAVPYMFLSYAFSIGKVSVKPGVSLRYYFNEWSDYTIKSMEYFKKFVFNPSITFQYKISEISSVYFVYQFDKQEPLITHLFPQFVATSYRSSITNEVNFKFQQTQSSTVSYRINDFFNLFTLDAGITGIFNENSFFSRNEIDQLYMFTTQFLLKSGDKYLNSHINVTKYVHAIRSTFNLKNSYGVSFYKNVVNDSDVRSNSSTNTIADFTIRTGFKSFINFENQLILARIMFGSSNEQSRGFERVENTFSLSLKPDKQFLSKASLTYMLPNTMYSFSDYSFVDISISYSPDNRNISYSLKGANLLNNRLLSEYDVSDFSKSTKSINLIPRFIMGTISVDF